MVLQVPSDVSNHEKVQATVNAIVGLIPNTARVYFAAGASFPDCCINYVAAAHVDADTIVKLEPNCCPPDPDSPAQVLVIGRRSVLLPDQREIINQLLQTHRDRQIVRIVSDRLICEGGGSESVGIMPSLGEEARIRQVDLLKTKSSSPRGAFVAVELARWKLNLLALLVNGSPTMELTQGGLVPFNGSKVVAKRYALRDSVGACRPLTLPLRILGLPDWSD